MIHESERQPGADFIRLLRDVGVEVDERRLAEMVWLARLMTPEEEPVLRQTDLAAEMGEAAPTAPIEDTRASVSRGPIAIITRKFIEEPANEVFVDTAVDESGKVRVTRRRVAGVPPLPEAEALARALRPFQRRLRSAAPGPLDEEATARHAAESDLILPISDPNREKWFDVAVVFEDRPAMVVWRETIREFCRLAEQHPAFRDAQLWRIQFPEGDREPHLLSLSGAKRDLGALNDPAGRRLVFLFSDGVSPVWRDGRMRRAIEKWGARMPVALVQVINEEHWFRTAHGEPSIRVRAPFAGSPNEKLTCEDDIGVKLPIVMPTPRSLERWAAMLMNDAIEAPALLLPEPAPLPSPASSPAPLDVAERLRRMTSTARDLARFLSAVPLQIPVMRLVQQTMLPTSRIEHLAEVMLSGLVKRARPEQDVSALEEDRIDFDFITSETREELQRLLRFGELDYVLHCVSQYVGERIGRRYDLRALIADSRGTLRVSEEEAPFARIAAQALAQHGIRPGSGRGKTIESRGIGWVDLTPFSFETLTMDARGHELKGSRRTLEARQFVEPLADDLVLEMVEVPGGSFLMGTNKKDVAKEKKEIARYYKEGADWIDCELPQHEVRVPDFYIGKYPITQRQWRVIAENASLKVDRDLDPNPSHFKGKEDSDDRPVEQVSWEDVKEFCARLTKKTGREYRLPTEAEWEYACRAGTTTPFAFGETITPEIVNYDGNSPYAKAKKGRDRNETIPVGSLGMANAFGLYDMHGNVWEWCEDLWHSNYEGAPADGSAWLSGGGSSRRVLRGGSWGILSFVCRSAVRRFQDPVDRDLCIGVRVVVARVP